jgi:hypothetical protein
MLSKEAWALGAASILDQFVPSVMLLDRKDGL